MVPTCALLIMMSPAPGQVVIPVTALSCSRLVSRAGSDGPPFGLKLSWKGSPYKLGVAVRCDRLAPKTAVAQRARTASTVPISAVPTGTDAAPRPRSSA